MNLYRIFFTVFLLFTSFNVLAVNRTTNEDTRSFHDVWTYSGNDTSWQYHSHRSPSHGILRRLSAEQLEYKPYDNYCGSDQYQYTIKKPTSGGGGGYN